MRYKYFVFIKLTGALVEDGKQSLAAFLFMYLAV